MAKLPQDEEEWKIAMADFISEWWGTAIAIVTAISILACAILLWAQSR